MKECRREKCTLARMEFPNEWHFIVYERNCNLHSERPLLINDAVELDFEGRSKDEMRLERKKKKRDELFIGASSVMRACKVEMER